MSDYYYSYNEQAESPLSAMQMNCVRYSKRCNGRAEHNRHAFGRHNHETLEILAVTKGILCVTLDHAEYRMKAGDTLVVSPFLVHGGAWSSEDDGDEYICITVSLSRWLAFRQSALFAEAHGLLAEEYGFDSFFDGNTADGKIVHALAEEIDGAFRRKDAVGECLLSSAIYRMLGFLFDGHCHPSAEAGKQKKDINFQKVVSRYLSEHYAEDLSTARIAAELYMTTQAFCYAFKRQFGTSFLPYLCRYRVNKATEIVREKEIPLNELATAVGFSDYGHFCRSFKKILGQSPAVWFGRRKEQELKK